MKAEPQNLSGLAILVTGGARGIGAEICTSLTNWNAHVLLACRNLEQGEQLKQNILATNANAQITVFADADTSDLNAMKKLSEQVKQFLGDKPLDGLILNAGIAGIPYKQSKQGFEMHVATNVLGHHLLSTQLLHQLQKSQAGKIIYVTGDIYVLANSCSLNSQYSEKQATYAYARSKLGVSWNALSMHLKCKADAPSMKVIAVHPGVVNSDLIQKGSWFKKLFLISAKTSAQTVLYCLSDDALQSGSYIHNVRGVMRLPNNDPVLQTSKREQFWLACNTAVKDYL